MITEQQIDWLIDKVKKDLPYLLIIAMSVLLYSNEKERRMTANLTISSVREDRDAWRYLYIKCIREDTAKLRSLSYRRK